MSDTSLLVPDWSALEQPHEQALAAPRTPQAPEVGTILNGYRFTGGDPADQKSWSKLEAPKRGDVVQGYRFEGGDPGEQSNWHKLVDYAAKDVPGEAVENLLPSIGKHIGEMWEGVKGAVEHPLDTALTLGKLGYSSLPGVDTGLRLASAASQDFLPPEIASKVKGAAQNILAPKEAMQKDYADTYGGWENLKRTLAEDPTRPLFDALSFVAPESRIGLLDPVTAAAKAGRLARKGARLGVNEMVGHNIGTGPAALENAFDIGRMGGQKQRDFLTALGGNMDTEDIVNLFKQGVQNIRDDMMARFKANRPLWASKSQLPPAAFDDIDTAQRKAIRSVFPQDANGNIYPILSKSDSKKLIDLSEIIDQWRQEPARHNIEDLDNLKKRIRNEVNWRQDNPNFKRVVTEMTNGIVDTIKNYAPPEYAPEMAEYAKMSKMIAEIENSFGLGGAKEKAAATILGKLQKTLRNNVTTQYGQHAKDMAKVQTMGGVDVMPSLSGSMLGTLTPRGHGAANAHSIFGHGLAGAVVAAPFTGGASLLAIPPLVAGYVSGMPRIWGGLYNRLGRTAGVLDRAAGKVPRPVRGALSVLADPRTRRGPVRLYGDIFAPEDDDEEAR